MKKAILVLLAVFFIAMLPMECASVGERSYSQIDFGYGNALLVLLAIIAGNLISKVMEEE